MWRKSLGKACKVTPVNDDRLLLLELQIKDKRLQLVNVYLPYDDGTNIDDFRFYLAKANSLCSSPLSGIIGDFNANIRLDTHRFGNELKSYCIEEKKVISDCLLCKPDTFTFLSSAHNSVAWLDHFVGTSQLHDRVTKAYVDYSFITSDHFPLFIYIDMPENMYENDVTQNKTNAKSTKIAWEKLSEEDKELYKAETLLALSYVKLDHSLILCNDPECTNAKHLEAIDASYEQIVQALCLSGSKICQQQRKAFKPVPLWNEVCAEHHNAAREAFLTWRANNRPRSGALYDLMRTTRARFKLVFKELTKDSSITDSNRIASKLLHRGDGEFWKEVTKLNQRNLDTQLADTVNGCCGAENIVNMWKDHFTELLNSHTRVNMDIDCSNSVLDSFSQYDVNKAVFSLKCGKAAGHDGLSAEHFKFAHRKLDILLSVLINCIICHNHLPQLLMKTIIIPIVKDKKGDLSSVDNYRPVAITTIVSKVFEQLLLSRYQDKLDTSNNQFGFKASHSTDMCIFVMKQVIEFYNSQSSPVYICFMDASKAFDRTNHCILFRRLLGRKVPSIIVRILDKWYSSQSFCIRWGSCMSDCFKVTNGVRQGGILSPHLFNIYTDELSKELTAMNIGCTMNGQNICHLLYADDTVLLAPSPSALQKLIDKCEVFANKNFLVFNAKKTKIMCIKPKQGKFKDVHVPLFYLNGNKIVHVNKEKYLGYVICDNNTDDDDMQREIRSIFAKVNTLCRNFRECDNIVKSKLFKSYCSSLYCCALWTNYKACTIKRVRISMNKSFKYLMKRKRDFSASLLFVTHNVDSFPVLQRKYVFSLCNRLLHSHNEMVCCIMQSAFIKKSAIFKRWESILF